MSIDIQVSRSKGRSKVKPTLHMLGKGGICVLQTAIFEIHFTLPQVLQECAQCVYTVSQGKEASILHSPMSRPLCSEQSEVAFTSF